MSESHKIAEQQNDAQSVQDMPISETTTKSELPKTPSQVVKEEGAVGGEADSTTHGPVITTYSGSAFEPLKLDANARVTKISVPSDGTAFSLRRRGGKNQLVVKMEPIFLAQVKAQIVKQFEAEILAEMREEECDYEKNEKQQQTTKYKEK